MTQILEALWQAYSDTYYQVAGNQPFTLQVGRKSQPLLALHRQQGVNASAYITACNLLSQPLSEADNQARHLQLKREMVSRGLVCLEGVGKHPDNNWPGETSLLVLGIGYEAACELGREYGQNAIVWNGEGGIPRLVDLL